MYSPASQNVPQNVPHFKSMCLNEAQSEAQNEAHIDGEQGFPREKCSKLVKIGHKKPNITQN